jgi:hypothetical protein
MNNKEKEIVTEDFCLREDTYNICEGGKGGFSYINNKGLNYLHSNRENSLKNLDNGRKIVHEKLQNDKKFKDKFKVICANNLLEYRKNGNNGFKGKKHSKDTKKKIGLINSIKQKGKNNSQFESCWITNQSNNKKIKKQDLDIWLKLGWICGRFYD